MLPEASDTLRLLKDEDLFHLQHRLRHPAAIYTLSLVKLGGAYKECASLYLSLIEVRDEEETRKAFTHLLVAQEHLLRTLQEHFEDCLLVLKTLVDPLKAKGENQFTESLLRDCKLPGLKSFFAAVEPIRERLRIANRIRHNQGRLKDVMYVPYGDRRPGFFLEEPDETGALGPSPVIHPDQGCISFAFDLRSRMFDIYRLSAILKKAVLAAGSRGQSESPHWSPETDVWFRALELASRIPSSIFPKERLKRIPRIDLTDGDLLISTVSLELMIFPPNAAVSTSWTPDGFSNRFKVPFP